MISCFLPHSLSLAVLLPFLTLTVFLSLNFPNSNCSSTVVIDFCLVKELMCEHDTNYQCLKLNWASKASLIQRRGHVTYTMTKHILSVLVTIAGRAGRVSSGRCFRLITKNFYASHLLDFSTPEMQVRKEALSHENRSPLHTPAILQGLGLYSYIL